MNLCRRVGTGVAALCAWASTWCPASPAQPPARPNVIVIFTDDQGWADLSCQGSVDDIRTPHIDRLAREGVRMTAGYVTAPQCVPSRTGLLTGRYQQRFGVDHNGQGAAAARRRDVARTHAAGRLRHRHDRQVAPGAEPHLYELDLEESASLGFTEAQERPHPAWYDRTLSSASQRLRSRRPSGAGS